MSDKNPYISFSEEAEGKPQKKEEAHQEPSLPVAEVAAQETGPNPYVDLIPEDAGRASSFDPNEAAWWSGLGGAGGYLSSGAGIRRLSPNPATVAADRGARLAETLTGAPQDILAKIAEQQKAIPGVQAAAEAAVPGGVVQPETGGGKWSQNWAGVETPVEEGVPQASARYNRSKGQGKVTSRLTKMYGPNPKLSIQQYPSAAAAAEADSALMAEAAERARKVQQAVEATNRAAKLAPVLTVLNRTATGAGLGLGAYDMSRRYKEGDMLGTGLSAIATGVGTLFPPVAPLAAAGMALYDSPEARQRFLEAMQPGGAYERRMEGRFGLD